MSKSPMQPHREGGPWFKVVWTSGYDNESRAQHLICDNMTLSLATAVCDQLREESTWEGDWWIVVPQKKALRRGMEEFV